MKTIERQIFKVQQAFDAWEQNANDRSFLRHNIGVYLTELYELVGLPVLTVWCNKPVEKLREDFDQIKIAAMAFYNALYQIESK